MSETVDLVPNSTAPAAEATRPIVSPSESRFMFVDVAAARAKQLRRGAIVRIATGHDTPKKLERLAMEEVRRGLIEYTLPELRRSGAPAVE